MGFVGFVLTSELVFIVGVFVLAKFVAARSAARDRARMINVEQPEPLKASLTARRPDSVFYSVVLLVVGGAVLAFFLLWTLMTPRSDHPDDVSTTDVSALQAWIEPEMSEADKAAKEDLLLEEARSIPASDRDANLKIYQQLAALRPNKRLYKQKVDHYARLVSRGNPTAPTTDSSPTVDSSSTTTDEFTNDDIDHGLAAICTIAILNLGQSGPEMLERAQGLICEHYKICGERSRKLMQATADHFGGWDEVSEKCEEAR